MNKHKILIYDFHELFIILDEIKDLLNLDVEELDGLAIMSDTDNSKMVAIAYYQNIYFSSK